MVVMWVESYKACEYDVVFIQRTVIKAKIRLRMVAVSIRCGNRPGDKYSLECYNIGRFNGPKEINVDKKNQPQKAGFLLILQRGRDSNPR